MTDSRALNTLAEVPEHLEQTEESLMTNFDHSVNPTVLRQVLEGTHWADYPGWNFYGLVWYADGQLHCMVKRFFEHVDTISARDPEALMCLVSQKYGWA